MVNIYRSVPQFACSQWLLPNSCINVPEISSLHSHPRLAHQVSKRDTTSLVSFGDKSRNLGEKALDLAVRNWANTIGSLKRLVGIKYGSDAYKYVGFRPPRHGAAIREATSRLHPALVAERRITYAN